MLKNIVLIGIGLLFTPVLFSQINARPKGDNDFGNRRAPCFMKSVNRLGQQYVNWECDPNDNIVDCNEALESDPGSNLVRTRETGHPFTGDCESCFRNGLREHIVHFVNGQVDGIDTTFYESGCPQVVRNHIEGVENGFWTYFNDTSGLIAWQINYFNGEKEGKAIFYRQRQTGTTEIKVTINDAEYSLPYSTYENDTVKIEHYKEGILNGVKKEYYWPGSKIKREVNYKQGIFDGSFIEYNTEGNVLQELNYTNGEKDGLWKYYYNDGTLLKTENWKKEVKEGEFKTFYIGGEVQILETYRKGLKEGKFMERYPDNSLKREAYYKKDELIEEHVFDKNGNEIKTVGGKTSQKTEDDALPTEKSKKKKKEKKPKKEKKVKKSKKDKDEPTQ